MSKYKFIIKDSSIKAFSFNLQQTTFSPVSRVEFGAGSNFLKCYGFVISIKDNSRYADF